MEQTKLQSQNRMPTAINLLLAIGGLWLILIAICSSFYCTAADDWFFISLTKEHGLVNSIELTSTFGSPRVAAISLLQTVFWINQPWLYSAFIFVSTLFFCASLFTLLHQICKKQHWSFRTQELIAFTLFIASAAYFIAPQKGEMWLWVSALPVYLWSISFSMLITAKFLKKTRTIYDWLVIFISVLYLGNSSESYSLWFAMVLGAWYGYSILIKKTSWKSTRWIFIVLFVICGFALLQIFSEGNQVRRGQLPTPDLWVGFTMSIRFIGKQLLVETPLQIRNWIVFLLPLFFFGKQILNSLKLTLTFKILVAYTIIFSAATWISVFMQSYALSSFPPQRSIIHVWLLWLIIAIIWTIYLGNLSKIELRKPFKNSILIIPLAWVCFTLVLQTPKMANYAKCYHQRTQTLRELNGKPNTTVIVKALPYCGFLMNSEITPNELRPLNQHYAKMLNLNFGVRIEK
jgi:hypothetical protein